MAFEVNPVVLTQPFVGVAYSFTLTFSGGTILPYCYLVDSGTLPDGLSFSQPEGPIVGNTLTISGTPTSVGVSLMNIHFAYDACASPEFIDRIFTFDVQFPPPTTTPKKKKQGIYLGQGQFCVNRFDRFGKEISCPPTVQIGNAQYVKIDIGKYQCCYRRIK